MYTVLPSKPQAGDLEAANTAGSYLKQRTKVTTRLPCSAVIFGTCYKPRCYMTRCMVTKQRLTLWEVMI